MQKSPMERRAELINLLTWAQLPPDVRKEAPFPGGRQSPLWEEEAGMKETAAILAARHPAFNGDGLGFDLPGSGDWPDVILVGVGGRVTNEDAIGTFFGFPENSDLPRRMREELPSAGLVAAIAKLDSRRPTSPATRPEGYPHLVH